jgi:hypothetical protein
MRGGAPTAAAVAQLHDDGMTASTETLPYKLTLGGCILAGSGRCCVLDQSVVAVHWPGQSGLLHQPGSWKVRSDNAFGAAVKTPSYMHMNTSKYTNNVYQRTSQTVAVGWRGLL